MKIHKYTYRIHASILACGLALSALTPLTFAQEEPPPGDRPFGKPPRWEKLQEPLGLTADQLEELQTIGKAHREAAEKLREDDSLTKEQRREKFQSLREEGKKEIASVLTVPQREKLDEIMAQKREKHREMREERMGKGSKDRRCQKDCPES